MQAADKKRPKEERETLHRIRPFARLQSSEDYENFAADILCTLFTYNTQAELTASRRRPVAQTDPGSPAIPPARFGHAS